MPLKETRIEIETLAKELENRKHEKSKTVLVLGSRAGALFRSSKFYDEMAYLSPTPQNLSTLSITEQFSSFYALLKTAKKQNLVEDIIILLTGAIKNSMRSTEDTSLAELVNQHIFNTIFSLNMDDLLYSAFIKHGLELKQDFADFAFGQWQPEQVVQEILEYTRLNVCKLIRIYNDENSFISRLNDEKLHDEEYSRCMRLLLGKWKIKDLLIVGWDPIWDEMLPLALPPSLDTIWFVNEDENTKNAFLAKYQSYEHLYYIRTTYNGFCNGLRMQVAPEFIASQEFQHRALHDIQAIRSEFKEMQNQIDQTNKKVGQVNQAITAMKNDISNHFSDLQRDISDLRQIIENRSSSGGGNNVSH